MTNSDSAAGPVSFPHEVGLLLAARRVRDGQVMALGTEGFTHQGRPFPGVLVEFVQELLDHGQARVDIPDHDGVRRVVLTDAGVALLVELEDGDIPAAPAVPDD